MHKRTIALCAGLADGVTADLTLQARFGLWPAYSEYQLYAPIVLIAHRLGWRVSCEHKLPKKKIAAGDNRRLDFMFTRVDERLAVAMEVKRARDPKRKISVTSDLKKLRVVSAPTNTNMDARLLLVAGPHEIASSGVIKLRPPISLSELTPYVVRGLGTRKRAWGTTVFRLN